MIVYILHIMRKHGNLVLIGGLRFGWSLACFLLYLCTDKVLQISRVILPLVRYSIVTFSAYQF